MARLSRVEIFAPDEIAIVHVMNHWSDVASYWTRIPLPEKITTIARPGSNHN